MHHELRQFPRIPIGTKGELAIQKRGDRPGVRVLHVELRSIACKGASLQFDADDAAFVQPCTEAALSFDMDGRTITIPARVVWSAAGKAGLRLQLGKADRATREAYASWIVPMTDAVLATTRKNAVKN